MSASSCGWGIDNEVDKTNRTRLIESQRAGVLTEGGSIAIVGNMIRTESITSLYRGLVATVSPFEPCVSVNSANTEIDCA